MRTFPNPHAKALREVGRPVLSRLALSTLLILLGLGGGVEMLTLWWLQTPTARVQNLSEELIMGAQLTGLLGGYLLLIEVALMARLRSEVLSKQSTSLDAVSGATYTSKGYLESLNAALEIAAPSAPKMSPTPIA